MARAARVVVRREGPGGRRGALHRLRLRLRPARVDLLPKQGAREPWRLRQTTARRRDDPLRRHRGRRAAVLRAPASPASSSHESCSLSPLARTPEPPYVAVVSSSVRTGPDAGYAAMGRATGRARRAAAGLPRDGRAPATPPALDHAVLRRRRGRGGGVEAGRPAPRGAAREAARSATPTTGSGSPSCSGTTGRDVRRTVESGSRSALREKSSTARSSAARRSTRHAPAGSDTTAATSAWPRIPWWRNGR